MSNFNSKELHFVFRFYFKQDLILDKYSHLKQLKLDNESSLTELISPTHLESSISLKYIKS